jgi:MinD-like ATPase involved in chromosome partitioning or flagellar assembly
MFQFPTSPQEAGKGILISFLSCRQGAGASSLACMTAITAANIKQEVSLIDFNPESKVRAYMGYPGAEITTLSILNINSVNSPDVIYSASEQHHSGVNIFPGVIPKVTDAQLIDSKLVLKAATYLKQSSPLTIAVLSPLYSASWIVPMISDVICIVVKPDRPNLDNFRDNVEFLARLGCSGRMKIILNQQGYPGSIDTADVIKWFSPDIIIPYNKNIAADCNRRELRPDRRIKDQLIKLIKGVEEFV